MEKGKKRISIISIVILLIIIVAIIVLLKVFLFNNTEENDINQDYSATSNTTSNTIKDIAGNDYVKVEDGARINVSDALQSDKALDDFTFNNFYIYSVDGATRIEFDVTNNLNIRCKLNKFKLLIYTDKEKAGEILCTGDEFAAGQVKRLSVTVNADLANMYNLEVKAVYIQEM